MIASRLFTFFSSWHVVLYELRNGVQLEMLPTIDNGASESCPESELAKRITELLFQADNIFIENGELSLRRGADWPLIRFGRF